MYALIVNNIVEKFPYTINELKKDNPGISFPKNPSVETLENFNIFPVLSTGAVYDSTIQTAIQSGCKYNKERKRWETDWIIRDKTSEELVQEELERKTKIEQQRSEAYRNESDPIFFKYQRGEATQQEWLDKIAEIKARFPN